MVDENNFPTGKTTTEGTKAYIDENGKYITFKSELKAQYKLVDAHQVVDIVSITTVFLHGLGHYKDQGVNNEYEADEYERKVYNSGKIIP